MRATALYLVRPTQLGIVLVYVVFALSLAAAKAMKPVQKWDYMDLVPRTR